MAKKAAEKKVEAPAEAAVEAPKAAVKDAPNGKRPRWYVIQTQSNYEKRVHAAIKEQAMMTGLDKFIEEVLIPTEEVVEVKKGVKTSSERKFFPGYVLIKAVMTDEVWHLIRGTTHVTGFLGAERGRKPLPISEKEAQHILQQVEEGVERPRTVVSFEIGEEVRVVDGPFASFQGMVEEIDEEKSKVKVSVSIFGRATPIELDFTQVEKG